MEITYNLRSQQKIAFSLILGVLAFIIILIPSMVFLFPESADESTDFFIYAMAFAGLTSVLTACLAYYFLKDAQLMIDKTGMRSTSRLLSLHPQFKPVNFDSNISLYKVEDVGKTMLGSMAKLDASLQKNDTLFAFVNRHKTSVSVVDFEHKKIFMMSNNVWEIDDIERLETKLIQLGLTIESVQAKVFIEEFMPQMADLGKKAGYIAFVAITFLMSSMLLLNHYDTWSTIYYGSFKNILWLVFLVFSVSAFFYIKSNKKQMDSHIFIAGFFGVCSVLFFLAGILMMTPKMGENLPLTFKYTEKNIHKEEVWTAIENPKLKIFCFADENKKEPPILQKTIAKKWFSIIRVEGKKTFCPHGRYLSDATLPHE